MEENKNNKKAFLIIILSIIFYAIFLLVSDLNKISIVVNQIKWEYLLGIIPLVILIIIINGIRYHFILKEIKIKLNVKNSIEIFIAGLSMLVTPGGSGTLIKSYILKKQTGKSISSTGPVIIFEKWLEFISIIIIIGILLLKIELFESQLVFFIGGSVAVFLLVIFRNSHGIEILNKILSKLPLSKKFIIETEEFKKTSYNLFQLKNVLKFLGITLVTKIITLYTVYLIFESFDSNYSLFLSGQIYFTSMLIGVLTFVPGGVIITEGGMLGLLVNNGSEYELALVITLFVRFLTFWVPIIIGFILLKKFLLEKPSF